MQSSPTLLSPSSSSSSSSQLSPDDLELAVSSGGSAAVLAGVGTFVACELAGIYKWRRLFGVSGGAVITSLAACGMSAKGMISMALAVDFDGLITWREGILYPFFRLLGTSRSEGSELIFDPDWRETHWTGLFGTCGLNRIICELTRQFGMESKWPENFTTMATTRDGSQVVFNNEGVFHLTLDGARVQLTDKPVPLAFAVRASSTIPGVLAALEFKGVTLYDGAMSRDGLCPVGLLVRNFGADPRKILACRVGEDNLKPIMGRLHRAARIFWRVHPNFHWGPETAGVMEFRPAIDHVQTLKFKLSPDEKWYAILTSFEACVARLAVEGLLFGEKLKEAREIIASLGYWRDAVPSPIAEPQRIAINAERVFREHGLI